MNIPFPSTDLVSSDAESFAKRSVLPAWLSISLLFHLFLFALSFGIARTQHRELISVDFMSTPRSNSQPADRSAAVRLPKMAPKKTVAKKLVHPFEKSPSLQASADSLASAPPTLAPAGASLASVNEDSIGNGASKGSNSYLGELRSRIESLKQYPALSRNRGQTGKAEIGFTILKSGAITNLHFVKETPFESLNRAAMAAVSGLGQFKPIPDEFARSEWSLVIPIVFRMDN